MPVLALALFAFWFLTLFALRSFVQWRRTGATGFNGFDGPVGSLPWFAGIAFALGFLFVGLAPLAALLAWPGAELYFAGAPLHVGGTLLAVIGTVATLAAQFSMGDSWRIGVDASEKTRLVTTGLFAWVRNPIFTFLALTALGFFIMVPNAWSLAGLLTTLIGIELQVRFVEEPYLRRTHGECYENYAALVGRFLPGVGRVS